MANVSAHALERWETESYTSDYFEPDIMLPDQYHARRVAGVDGGERKLMAALLSDGVQVYLEQAINYVRGTNTRIDAIEWVENKDSVYIFSFDNVCAGLGINPDYLRVGLARYILKSKNGKKKNAEPFPVWKRIRRPRKR